jgi:hypothetical protein
MLVSQELEILRAVFAPHGANGRGAKFEHDLCAQFADQFAEMAQRVRLLEIATGLNPPPPPIEADADPNIIPVLFVQGAR